MNMAKALGIGPGIVDERMGPSGSFASDGQPYEMVTYSAGSAIEAMGSVLRDVQSRLAGAKGILEWRIVPTVAEADSFSVVGWRARARFRVVPEGTRLKKWDESRQCYVDADGVFACDEPLKPELTEANAVAAMSEFRGLGAKFKIGGPGVENSSPAPEADRNEVACGPFTAKVFLPIEAEEALKRAAALAGKTVSAMAGTIIENEVGRYIPPPVRGNCGKLHQSADEWVKCKTCEALREKKREADAQVRFWNRVAMGRLW